MSSTTHTPGPWFVTRREYSPCSIESAASGSHAIAKVYLTNPSTRKRAPEFAANAALIAAAPEMLASLHRLSLAASTRDNIMGDACSLIAAKAELAAANEAAIAAISKATAFV